MGSPGSGARGKPWSALGPAVLLLSQFVRPDNVSDARLGEGDVEQTRETPLSAGSLRSSEDHARQIKKPEKPRC